MVMVEGERGGSTRAVGRWGTAARGLLGGFMVASVVQGSLAPSGTVRPASWLLGLVAFPAVLLGWQAWQARRNPGRLVALTGPLGHLITAAVFVALYATPWYARPIGFVSDAALLFFGSSMLVAAYRGYAGCELLSVSNWVLRRDDQVGCVLFDPLDRLEGRSGG